jgi:hypothetical protein
VVSDHHTDVALSKPASENHSLRVMVFCLLRPANWAWLQTVEQPPPPVPLLCLREVLVLKVSSFSQLLANIRVADPHGPGFLDRQCTSGPMHLCSLTCWRSAPMVRSFRPTVAPSSLSSWTKRSRSQLWKASSMALVKSERSVKCELYFMLKVCVFRAFVRHTSPAEELRCAVKPFCWPDSASRF